jgi:hypothetical protein
MEICGHCHASAVLSPKEVSPDGHWVGGWVYFGADLDNVEGKKLLPAGNVFLTSQSFDP